MPKFLKMQYTNNVGETIAFGEGNYFINESDIHDYTWDYQVDKNDITFTKELKTKSIPCTVIGENRKELANHLFEVIDKDVRENIPGTLYVGEYRIDGYFYGEEASKYANDKIIRIQLKFISTSEWVKVEHHSFRRTGQWKEKVSKNLLITDLNRIKSLNNDGEWDGDVYTYQGYTYTFPKNAHGDIIGVLVNGGGGSSSGQINILDTDEAYEQLTDGDYIVSGGVDYNNSFVFSVNQNAVTSEGGQEPITISSATDTSAWIAVAGLCQDVLFQPMVRSATVTDGTFEPYYEPYMIWVENVGDYLDFDYDFNYDYKPEIDNHHITNHDYTASDFVMKIYGYVQNPYVIIAGHLYQVNINVNTGAYLEIDSMKKTITTVEADGGKSNVFYARDKDSYIFEKIPSGTSEILYPDDEDFYMDIAIYMKRGAPKWT